MSIHYFANPTKFTRLAGRIQPWAGGLTVALLLVGLYLALVRAPADYQQGETVRIMFVHVPSAWMALFCYSFLAVASAVALILETPPSRSRGKGFRSNWRQFYIIGSGDWLFMGQAYVGHLVGMGCQIDLGFDLAVSLSWLYGAMAGDRG